ncbi:hypothetical protein EXS70_04135 [Candidatus Peribacteria bacterium]|nr:hypothetical protein [Candidatus Peribacteria bacterium]
MQPLFFSLLAMAFYALEISITDWRLTNLSPRLLTACYSVGVAIFSISALFLTHEKISNPSGRQSIWIILMVIASFFAASAHFQALHLKAGALQLTLIYCLLPVAASLYTAIFEHKFPSIQMVAAWVLAGISLYLIATARPVQLP